MRGEPGGFKVESSGAYFGWVKHPRPDLPTEEVVKQLVLEHDVLAIPGAAYRQRRIHDRLSFANLDPQQISELPSDWLNSVSTRSIVIVTEPCRSPTPVFQARRRSPRNTVDIFFRRIETAIESSATAIDTELPTLEAFTGPNAVPVPSVIGCHQNEMDSSEHGSSIRRQSAVRR